MKIKTYLILSGIFLFLYSCGKNEKQIIDENAPSLAVQSENPKPAEQLLFRKSEDIVPSEELNLSLLKKTAENLNIKYSNIKIEDVSSIRYNNETTFFVICVIKKNKTKSGEEDLGNYYERKFVFVNNEDGKILAEETDKNLGYYENEGLRVAKTYILNNVLQLNDKTPAIAFSTEVYSNSRVVMYSEEKFTIVTFDGNRIRKVLYEYPIRSANGDSNGGGTYQIETLETGISLSASQTSGFYDLLVSKIYTYEDAAEEDLENDIQQKSDLKVKKEFQKLKFDGKTYSFKKDDRNRFL
ncbi:hypothetical protein DBB36_13800 [Flavobacterium sp. WLB]|uniref:hypothetical protein n=1 Tax=unclassified Flavobacterium TaxID=196869 RepID=UPI0006AB8777|nr:MULTISPECIES: hypothetical protein [unclassified Flavobacterium]KOP37064.1 hypothetical protein AKO67_16590 [Flavobacterium sp. VMW]OWU89431.1 hypothetical protein APR43_16755 [Flavobacterium sp. NLM]PUU69420.1 hypothetical protein DBB36_13800 [Flavobacterium sp. WLB]